MLLGNKVSGLLAGPFTLPLLSPSLSISPTQLM
jgi:hypothetical protein